jgi:hypothetical protein
MQAVRPRLCRRSHELVTTGAERTLHYYLYLKENTSFVSKTINENSLKIFFPGFSLIHFIIVAKLSIFKENNKYFERKFI